MILKRFSPMAGLCLLFAGCSPTSVPDVALPNACYVESVSPPDAAPGSTIVVKGWAYVPSLGRPADTIAIRFVRADGLVYQRPLTPAGERPDVVAALKAGDATVAGFDERINLDRFAQGRYAVVVAQRDSGRTYACATPATLTVL
jgi:hypothetical protein